MQRDRSDDKSNQHCILCNEAVAYQNEAFSKYHTKSVKEFRFTFSGQIIKWVFYATFVYNIENNIKLNSVMNVLKQLIVQPGI